MHRKRFLFLLFLMFLIVTTIVASSDTQKIKTKYVDFELPMIATHIWNSAGLDSYEIIVSNLSVEGNDYILKLSWEDERYIEDTIQIHYFFKNNKLKADNIVPYSLTKYNKTCLNELPSKMLDKSHVNCLYTDDKSKLKFDKFNIESGTIIGYKEEELPEGNVTVPIYSWKTFKDIEVTKGFDFLAIDDVKITSCGKITSPGNYFMNQTITIGTSNCIDIESSNVSFDCKGNELAGNGAYDYAFYWITTDNLANITIKSCNVTNLDYAAVWATGLGPLNILNSSIEGDDSGVYSTIDILNINDSTIIGGGSWGIGQYGSYPDTAIWAGGTEFHVYNTYLSGLSGVYLTTSNTGDFNNVNISATWSVWPDYYENSCGVEFNNVLGSNDLPVVRINETGIYSGWHDNFSQFILCEADDSQLINFSFNGDNSGVSIIRGDNITIKDSQFGGSSHESLFVNRATNLKVKSSIFNTSHASTYGNLYLFGSSNSLVENNTFYNNNQEEVTLDAGTGNVTFNTFHVSGGWTVYYDGGASGYVYNNLFNNTGALVNNPFEDAGSSTRYITPIAGTRIYGTGVQIGGNYFLNDSGGYSSTCIDADSNGFCDVAYDGDIYAYSDEYKPQTNVTIKNEPIEYTDDLIGNVSSDGFVPTMNETRWYNNSIHVTSLDNLINISFTNTTANNNWTFSGRMYDGSDWSNWLNYTVFINDTVTPDIYNITYSTTSFYSDVSMNVTINCTDVGLDISWAKVTLNTSGVLENKTMIQGGGDIWYYSSLYAIGTFYMTYFYCVDELGNLNSTYNNQEFVVSTRPAVITDGGGGGTTTEPKKNCNISVSSTSLQFFNNNESKALQFFQDDKVLRLLVSNHENFSFTPVFSINSLAYSIKTTQDVIMGTKTVEMTVLRTDENVTGNHTATIKFSSSNCKDILLDVVYTDERRTADVQQLFKDLIAGLIDTLTKKVSVVGNSIPFYVFSILIIIITIVLMLFAKIPNNTKVVSSIIIIIIANFLLSFALIPHSVSATEEQQASIDTGLNQTVESYNYAKDVVNTKVFSIPNNDSGFDVLLWVLSIPIFLILWAALLVWRRFDWWANILMAVIITLLILIAIYYLLPFLPV